MTTDNYYERFIKKSTTAGCQTQAGINQVGQAGGSTELVHLRTNTTVQVNLVINNKANGVSEMILFALPNQDLKRGDYLKQGDKYFLITNETFNVRLNATVKKYTGYMCNTLGYKGSAAIPLVFIDSLTSKVSANFKRVNDASAFVDFPDDNVIIFSSNVYTDLKENDSILINNTQWNLSYFNEASSFPVVYATVEREPNTLAQKAAVAEVYEDTYYTNSIRSFITEDYYIGSNPPCEIISREETLVKIKMPMFPTTVTITVKEDGDLVEQVIAVKESV